MRKEIQKCSRRGCGWIGTESQMRERKEDPRKHHGLGTHCILEARVKLKAISLHQPWASAMAIGVKKVETRSWQTYHSGLIAIHAATIQTMEQIDFFDNFVLEDSNTRAAFERNGIKGFSQLPFGAVVAVGDLLEGVRTEAISGLSTTESNWGDYSNGRFGWMFTKIWKLEEPFIVRGHQRIFNVDIPPAFLPSEVLTKAKS
jgi:hypothetical protein